MTGKPVRLFTTRGKLTARFVPFALVPALFPALFSAPALAQTAPDAGALQRETEQSIRRPPRPAVPPPIKRPPAADAQATRIKVQSFVVEGATLIPAAELIAMLDDQVGRSLTFAEIEHAAQRIAEHYRKKGWYARVYLPEQDVTAGRLRIHVLEGRFGGSRLDDQAPRANGEFVQRMVAGSFVAGEPLPAAALEQGLLRANDLPGIRATGILEAGEVAGETRLLLKVEDTPFVTGDLGANNHGVKSTGTAQAVGGVALNNLSGIGDRLALRALAADHLQSGVLNYSLPLGSEGWRLAAHASELRYRLGGSFKPLDAEGRAETWGATLSWAWLRTQERNLAFSAKLEQRRYADDALDTALRRHRVDAFSLGANGDFIDGLGGLVVGNLQVVAGDLDLREVAADIAADQAGPKSAGRYTKLGLQISRNQALAAGWSAQAIFSGQLADKNLGSSEKFSLGGPTGVRAYPVNEAAGDQGWLLNLELRRDLGNGWQTMAFFDTGGVQLHKDTWAGWQGGGDVPNRYSLSGAGLGLSWQRPQDWLLTASAAIPVGSNPGRSAAGRNNDGSDAHGGRFWLTASKSF